jgi:hypothetical protein
MRTLQNMPFSLAEPGPKDADGVGNCEHERFLDCDLSLMSQISSGCTRRTRQSTPPYPCLTRTRD